METFVTRSRRSSFVVRNVTHWTSLVKRRVDWTLPSIVVITTPASDGTRTRTCRESITGNLTLHVENAHFWFSVEGKNAQLYTAGTRSDRVCSEPQRSRLGVKHHLTDSANSGSETHQCGKFCQRRIQSRPQTPTHFFPRGSNAFRKPIYRWSFRNLAATFFPRGLPNSNGETDPNFFKATKCQIHQRNLVVCKPVHESEDFE